MAIIDPSEIPARGPSLEVEGVAYPPEKAGFAPAKGRVLLTPKEDQRGWCTRSRKRRAACRRTLTTTGATAVVRMQLADVEKESCKQLPNARPGEYECGMLLKVRSCPGECDPSGGEPLDDAKRIDIRRDPSGKWVPG